jgi:FkbM family methyltransferase
MISYAQNGEDVLLNRAFRGRATGFYVDVGANDPVVHSVTKHFYDLGWRGVNVEPHREMFGRLCRDRPGDVSLNLGVSNREGELTYHESRLTGLSTFSSGEAAHLVARGARLIERQVPVTTLARVCEQHVRTTIDFMSIDVEGLEHQVIEGGDWSRWRPRVVLVEATRPETTVPSHEDWEPRLLGADYLFAAFDGLNRYYVRKEDEPLLGFFATPVNVRDGHVPFEVAEVRRPEMEEALGVARRLLQIKRKFPPLYALMRLLGSGQQRS